MRLTRAAGGNQTQTGEAACARSREAETPTAAGASDQQGDGTGPRYACCQVTVKKSLPPRNEHLSRLPELVALQLAGGGAR
jgi:hypothetical protein